MSEENHDTPDNNPKSFLNGISDLLKSVIAFLSESSLLKQLAGDGNLEGKQRFWSYVLSNGILGYVALVIVVLVLVPSDTRLYALGIIVFIPIVLFFFWDKHATKQKKSSLRANLDIYIEVVDADSREPLGDTEITSNAVVNRRKFTGEDGRTSYTIANTSEKITLTAKKSGYNSKDRRLTSKDKEQGHLITVELQKKSIVG